MTVGSMSALTQHHFLKQSVEQLLVKDSLKNINGNARVWNNSKQGQIYTTEIVQITYRPHLEYMFGTIPELQDRASGESAMEGYQHDLKY